MFPVSVGHNRDSWDIWKAREKQQICFSLCTLLLTVDRKQPPGLNLRYLPLDTSFSFSDFGATGVSSVLWYRGLALQDAITTKIRNKSWNRFQFILWESSLFLKVSACPLTPLFIPIFPKCLLVAWFQHQMSKQQPYRDRLSSSHDFMTIYGHFSVTNSYMYICMHEYTVGKGQFLPFLFGYYGWSKN